MAGAAADKEVVEVEADARPAQRAHVGSPAHWWVDLSARIELIRAPWPGSDLPDFEAGLVLARCQAGQTSGRWRQRETQGDTGMLPESDLPSLDADLLNNRTAGAAARQRPFIERQIQAIVRRYAIDDAMDKSGKLPSRRSRQKALRQIVVNTQNFRSF